MELIRPAVIQHLRISAFLEFVVRNQAIGHRQATITQRSSQRSGAE